MSLWLEGEKSPVHFKSFFIKGLVGCLILLLSGCGERKVLLVPKPDKEKVPFDISNFDENSLGEAFKLLEWKTNEEIESEGSPKAVKGGTLRLAVRSFPPTFRTLGKDTNLQVISFLEGVVYESLLNFDSKTLEYSPSLATHWKESEDHLTFWFKLDPEARFSDGTPLKAEDIVETFHLVTDEEIGSPSTSALYKQSFYPPEALSSSIVKVKCRYPSWRNFLYFCSMAILPSHHIKKAKGKSYLKKYQYFMMPGTGPYILDYETLKRDKEFSVLRRPSYWAKDKPWNLGLFNFDRIKFLVIMDERLELEKFKKGEFDFYISSRAQWWVEELNSKDKDLFPMLHRNFVRKKKFFNFKPLGMSGIAFNTLEAPFDDKRVRQAISLLWNVEQLIEKLFFNEYVRNYSYFQGTVYENRENQRPRYDPTLALKLLKEAGWVRPEGEKWLQKEGKDFVIEFMIDPGWERVFTPFQKDLEQVGIRLELQTVNSQTLFKKVMKKQFKMIYTGWTGLLFPNPTSSMHSRFAKAPGSGNITGISSSFVDQICEQYDRTFDAGQRVDMLRKLDQFLSNEYYYALGWVAPYACRLAYWDRFGYPDTPITFSGSWTSLPLLWWHDPKKEERLKKAYQNPDLFQEVEEVAVNHPDLNKQEEHS